MKKMPPTTPKYFQVQSPAGTADTTPADSEPVDDEEANRPQPLLRLSLNDLSHAGTQKFLSHLDVGSALSTAVSSVLRYLYPHRHHAAKHVPPTRSITLVVRPKMAGVAYTTGIQLDDDHKEIHFSAEYIARIPAARARAEMLGVITHEAVHCLQYNGRGKAPGGLIEGIADWVRLRAGLVPPHWKREGGGQWDAGYQHTGYFLDWLEGKFGRDTVPGINEALRVAEYDEKTFWKELFRADVEELWEEYGKSLNEGKEASKEDAAADGKQDD